jgi:hypothetical protein
MCDQQAKINIEKLFLIAFHLAIAHLNMQELMNILIRVARRLITMKKGKGPRMGNYYVRLGVSAKSREGLVDFTFK